MAHFNPPAPGSAAIVTGASSGLGRAFALALARRGHPVLAVARRAERLAELAKEGDKGGARIQPLALDLTAEGAAARIHEAANALGEIGWLINNAGGSTFGRFEAADITAERALVRLNCEAVVTLTGQVLPELVARRRGIVINVASSAGMQPTPGWAVYGASKAFVLAFSEALYDELRGSGVSVTALAPGPVGTEFFAAGHASEGRRAPPWEVSPEVCAERALRAALAGRAVAVVGLATHLLTFGSRFSPRALARWVSGRISLRFIGLPPMPPRSSRS
jgi:short-subunit dehydrogenase